MPAQAQMDESPIGEVNTTPLIDVMLVLLVMFIITIPVQTHSVPLDLPSDSPWELPLLDRNKLTVTAQGELIWNGRSVSMSELRGLLGQVGSLSDQPELLFEPDAEARYELVDEILAAAKRANIAALGFVGNERYARF